jgi:hypothetical protein
MCVRVSIIDSTSEHIKDATVDVLTSKSAQPLIHRLGIASFEFGNAFISQIDEIPGDTWTYARNDLEVF